MQVDDSSRKVSSTHLPTTYLIDGAPRLGQRIRFARSNKERISDDGSRYDYAQMRDFLISNEELDVVQVMQVPNIQ